MKMRKAGALLMALGAAAALLAWNFDPTVASLGMSRTNNIGLLADKQLLGSIGGAMFIAGAVLYAAAAIATALEGAPAKDRPAQADPEPTEPRFAGGPSSGVAATRSSPGHPPG